ncbi:MAG: MG2 domain-containing protein [Candidatus Ozemobacteraceae bacterium]
MKQGIWRWLGVLVLVVCVIGTLAAAETVFKRAATAVLGGNERYLGVVALDKPIYRSGETVFARITVLNALDNTPLKDNAFLDGTIEIKGPKGDVVTNGEARGEGSVIGFNWRVPEGQAGGEYTLHATFPNLGFPPAERKFDIRSFRAPRLKSQIVFLRDGYGPGEKVTATLHSERAEGGIPDGANVTVSARVDGTEVHTSKARIDREGNLSVTFPLPTEIERGEGTLALAIEDGGIVETAAKTIPILLQTVDLQIYPEGGDLIAGLDNRVYFEARNLNGKPADLAGQVVDGQGKSVAEFRTEHEGRGRFVFSPKTGEKYALRMTEPASIKKEFPLPAVKENGVVLMAKQDVVPVKGTAHFALKSPESQKCFLTLSKRDRELDRKEIQVEAGTPVEVTAKPGNACGVLTATLWDAQGNPLAERIVFVEPEKKIRVSIETKAQKHVPGGDVELVVRTTDESDKPVGAMVGLTVTDESVLEMIDKREQAPRLPAMVLLENEVKEFADAHVYLDGKNAKSSLALDLLLGTQGWRRFALVDPTKFIEAGGDAARRVVALKLASVQERRNAMEIQGVEFGEIARGGINHAMANDKMEEANEPVMAARPPMPAAKPVPAPAAPRKEAAFDDRPPLADVGVGQDRQKMEAAMEASEKKKANLDLVGRNAVMGASIAFQRRQAVEYVREYAHKTRQDRKPGERSDFTETVFWNAGVKTDEKTGKAELRFQLSDSVTSFKVMADAFAANGALGEGGCVVESLEPFSIEPKMPLEVSAGDQILLPIGVINSHSSDLPSVTIKSTALAPFEAAEVKPLSVKAGSRVREILPIYVGSGSADVELKLTAKAGEFSDQVTRKIAVRPRGFPIEFGVGGLLSSKKPYEKKLTIPTNVLAGSLMAKAAVYPTPLANLTAALERLLQEPCGCFEQTSSSNYPLVMAQQYFISHTGIPQEIITRAKDLLEKGYNRLLGFECKKGGYEWFGEDPGHEALTAYGLLEFTDMSKVRDVDAKMMQRTREWLFARRDMKGGFTRERRALHTWIENRDMSNAYITWALLEAGQTKLDEEVSLIHTRAKSATDSYLLALSANVLLKTGDKAGAKPLLEKLAKAQDKSGFVAGAETSITQSGGDALLIETTALAILAWLNDPAYAGAVEKGMVFLAESCKGGRFSSTQATVLALRAIVNYDQARAHPKAPGSVQIVIDGVPVGSPLAFTADNKGALILPDFRDRLTPGDHQVELKMKDGSEMPFSLTVTWFTDQPANAPECKLALSASLKDSALMEGAVTEAIVQVENKTKDPLPMPVAIIGIPGGLEVRHDQLKELVKKRVIAAYEVVGRDVVLYWRGLESEQKVDLQISLVAAVPGTYEGPACRSYLYYTDEFKIWSAGIKAVIAPRK